MTSVHLFTHNYVPIINDIPQRSLVESLREHICPVVYVLEKKSSKLKMFKTIVLGLAP